MCQQVRSYCGGDGVTCRDNQRQRKLNEAVGRSNWKNAGGRRAHTSKLQRLKIKETQLIKLWQRTAWAYRVWEKAIVQLSVHLHGDMWLITSGSVQLQASITCSRKGHLPWSCCSDDAQSWPPTWWLYHHSIISQKKVMFGNNAVKTSNHTTIKVSVTYTTLFK